MDFTALNKQRKFILIAAAIGVISIFLPWISISGYGLGYSINGFHSYGIVVFLGFAAAGIVAILGDQTKSFDKAMWLVELVAGAAAVLFTILFMTDLAGTGSFGAGYGIGLWIGLLASAGVLVSAWLLKSPEDNLKDGFDSLKTKVTAATNANATASAGPGGTSKVDELEKLIKLKQEGKISEEEYQQLKSKIL